MAGRPGHGFTVNSRSGDASFFFQHAPGSESSSSHHCWSNSPEPLPLNWKLLPQADTTTKYWRQRKKTPEIQKSKLILHLVKEESSEAVECRSTTQTVVWVRVTPGGGSFPMSHTLKIKLLVNYNPTVTGGEVCTINDRNICVKEEVAWRTMVKVPLSNSFLERRDARRKFSESLGAGASLAPRTRQRISLGSENDWKFRLRSCQSWKASSLSLAVVVPT